MRIDLTGVLFVLQAPSVPLRSASTSGSTCHLGIVYSLPSSSNSQYSLMERPRFLPPIPHQILDIPTCHTRNKSRRSTKDWQHKNCDAINYSNKTSTCTQIKSAGAFITYHTLKNRYSVPVDANGSPEKSAYRLLERQG